MPWSMTSDVHTFVGAAGEFLRARPVDHTVLLTELAYLATRPQPEQRFGWFADGDGAVTGAFLQAPRHVAVLSSMPEPAALSLVDILPPPYDVDSRMGTAWPGRGLVEESRITLHRLAGLHAPAYEGQARTASEEDRDLLVDWYERMMAAFPEDPTDLAYVVDDPLSYGGITLWEVDGEPTAMAGRSRLVAGMVRLGATYAPDGDATAALTAACAAAAEVARDVLIFAPAGEPNGYRGLGFEPVLDRVLLIG
jgi:hypothetical protein